MNTNQFETHTLKNQPRGEAVKRILAAAIGAVDPRNAVKRYLVKTAESIRVGQKTYPLAEIERVLVAGFGKASIPMAQACAEILGERLSAGIVISKSEGKSKKLEVGSEQSVAGLPSSVKILSASHPVPDERGAAAAQEIIELLESTNPKDLVIFLISGGGSALLTSPAAGISLDDLQHLTKALLGCGAPINEINTLRKHLSRVKGGQLARLAAPAQVATLILSDVIGDPLDVIASGPTVPDPSTFADCWQILEKYQLREAIPTPIRDHLQAGLRGVLPETPKAGDSIFDGVHNLIVGNNLQAAQAAIEQAQTEGLNTLLLTTALQGEASIIGQTLAAIAKQIAATGDPIPRPACIVAGGETTVTLSHPHPDPLPKGEGGKGGRNQELALGAVETLAGLADVILITLATDGDDGPTDAAGAVVTGETLGRAARLGLNPGQFLSRHDAYHFFDDLGDLLKPGMTGTNVCDLTFIFGF